MAERNRTVVVLRLLCAPLAACLAAAMAGAPASAAGAGSSGSPTRARHEYNLQVDGVQFVSATRGFMETEKEHRRAPLPRLLFTRDAGRSWHQRTRGVPSEWAFVSPRSGFGEDEHWRRGRDRVRITRTTDGGRHWRVLSAFSFHVPDGQWESSIDFPSASVGYVASGGTIFRTTNAGNTWTRLPVRCDGSLVAMSFPTVSDGFAGCEGEPSAGMAPKYLLGTSDAGQSWHVVARSADVYHRRPVGRFPEYGYLNRTSFLSPEVGFLMLDRGGLLRTTNGGRTWKPMIFSDDVDTVNGASWVSPRIGFVAMDREGVIRTRDRGRHWHVVYRGAYRFPEGGVRIL